MLHIILCIVLLDNINYTLKVQGGHYFSRDFLFINTFQGRKEHGRLALIKSRKNEPHELKGLFQFDESKSLPYKNKRVSTKHPLKKRVCLGFQGKKHVKISKLGRLAELFEKNVVV